MVVKLNFELKFKSIFLFSLTIFFLVFPKAYAQVQSHPLSQIFPINTNLNMSNNSEGILYNITGVGYLGIASVALPSYPLDVAGSAWIRPSLFIGANKLEINQYAPDTLGIASALYVSNYLKVSSWMNASNVNVSDMLCLGGVCRSDWSLAAAGGWEDLGAIVRLQTASDSVNATTLWIDNTAGRVGIGTYSPSYALHVVGDVGWSGTCLLYTSPSPRDS